MAARSRGKRGTRSKLIRGRWRRRATLGAAAALGAMWLVAMWWRVLVSTGPIPMFGPSGSGCGVGITPGLALVGAWWDGPPVLDPTLTVDRSWGEHHYWWFEWEIEMGAQGMVLVGIPYWLMIVGCALMWGVLWRRRWRGVAQWVCRGCGYDLRGIEGGVCPECGRGG